MKTQIDETLIKCLTLPGQSGFEKPIRTFLMKEMVQYGDISRDNLGSLICKVEGRGNRKFKWFIGAHMDTCGFIVHSIVNGQIKCLNFGYQDTQACHLQPVAILTKNGYIKGLMHAIQEEKGKPAFNIDIGTHDSKKGKEFGIQAGDPIHFAIDPFLVGNPSQRIICSPRLDNRIGIFELLLLAKHLKENPPLDDVFLVATVEEETGGRGAKTAAQKINPDMALILDITYDEHPVAMGQGPVITLSDRSSILPNHVRDHLLKLAKDSKIPIQTEVWNIGGTDAGPVRVTGAGIPTIPILTATKNNHTPMEMACIDDCYSVVQFCQLIIKNSKEIQNVFQQ
ncbi:MAG: M42 family metallopeptidase [Candidatus Thorarchaeota archaeon]